MKPYANTPLKIPRSGIREIMDAAWDIKDVIHLEVGQPDFPTPDHIVEATCRYVREGHTKYIPNAGITKLRETVAQYFERKTSVKTSFQNILVTPGAVFSMATAFVAILEPGDEVLIPDPGWPNYSMTASLIHSVPIYYKLLPQRNFLPDIEELETLVTPRTKILLLCTPSNPTGQVYGTKLMQDLLEFARRHDLYVLSDEIYSEIIFDGVHTSALSYDKDERTLIISGMSKTYSMTGYRLGFTRASLEYVEIATKLQEAFVSCGTGFSQLAAIEGLEGPQKCVERMRDTYMKRRDIALEILKDNGLYSYTPKGAFYLMIDISSTGMDSRDFAFRLLHKKKVAVVPGITFGQTCQNHIRISFASSEESIKIGTQRICEMILQNSKNN